MLGGEFLLFIKHLIFDLLSFIDSDHNSPQYQTSYGQQNDDNRNKNSRNSCDYLLQSFQLITVHNRSTVIPAAIVITTMIAIITTIIPTIVKPLRIIARDAFWGFLLTELGACVRQEEESCDKDDCICFHWETIIS